MATIHHQIPIIIFKVIDELNMLSPPEAQLNKSPTTILLGEGGVLDSLGIINLIVSVEEKLMSDLGLNLILLDEESLSSPEGPYKTIDSFERYICSRIG